jgi:magnesium chelatase family protein
MLACVFSFALVGIEARPVRVEVDVGGGYPNFAIVGLPAASIRESRERIASAVRNSGYRFPPEKIIVNLAPAGIPKSGTSFDLPIALGILAASGQLDPAGLLSTFVAGELSLEGRIRRVRGVLSMAIASRGRKGWRLLVPEGNGAEARAIRDLPVGEAGRLERIGAKLEGEEWTAGGTAGVPEVEGGGSPCFSQVRGQILAKRALEVAAAGGHNVLMMGPPGGGKTLLARRIPGILPLLGFEESLEATRVHSAAGLLEAGEGLLWTRPFRAPHHTTSTAGMAGGGNPPRPGEISLSHNGVLFLDELAEFPRHVLETLRQPLEDGFITLVRSGFSSRFPARFMLVCSMNPCLCGWLGSPVRMCRCSAAEQRRYRQRVSGPMLDRIDLHVEVSSVEVEELEAGAHGATSAEILRRVGAARERQEARQGPARPNASLGPDDVSALCRIDGEGRHLLRSAFRRLGMSARSYHRVLKVARTIADLAGTAEIEADHVMEALQYRVLDRREG